MKDFRFKMGYRKTMSYAVPMYMVAEIDPIFDTCKRDKLIVFDVGANTGVWAKALLTHSDHFISELHMFEPLIGNYDKILSRSKDGFYEGNDEKLNFYNIGFSDTNAKLILNHDNAMSGYASISVDKSEFGPRSVPLDKKTEITVKTMDSFCKKNNIDQVDILKVDVEGHELDVLRGAEGLIKKQAIKNIIFEFGTHQLASNHTFKLFWEFFSSKGYKMYYLRGGTNGFGKVLINQYHTQFEDFTKVRMFYATVE